MSKDNDFAGLVERATWLEAGQNDPQSRTIRELVATVEAQAARIAELERELMRQIEHRDANRRRAEAAEAVLRKNMEACVSVFNRARRELWTEYNDRNRTALGSKP